MVPGKMVLGKMVLAKMVPEKNSPRKNGPWEKWSSKNWSPGNSETKNRGVGVEHRGACVECWDVINLRKPKTTQSQNSETNAKHGNKKSWDERRASWYVCEECSDVINLWKPKTRQQIFLDSFSVLQFGTYVGSWCKRQTFMMCVVESIDTNKKKSLKFPSILLTENNFWSKFFRGSIFRTPIFRGPFFGNHFSAYRYAQYGLYDVYLTK